MRRITLISVVLFAMLCATAVYAAASPDPSMTTVQKEVRIGNKVAKRVEQQIPRVRDPAKEARLALITERLCPYYQRRLDYSVRILELDALNAFSLPGGLTYITTGMLGFLKSEDEIAAILAHEFAHADRAHGILQMARNNRLSILTIAGIVAAVKGGGTPALMMSGALQTAIMGKYSIDMEKEADAIAIAVLHKSGYNPTAMVTAMERLDLENMKRPHFDPGIYQTHPEEKERIAAALKYMKDNNIEVDRRDVIGSLKTRTLPMSGDVYVMIDKTPITSLPDTLEARKFLAAFAKRIDESIEMETAPYDIRVLKTAEGEKRLIIRGRIVAMENEFLEGMPPIEEIRDSINKAISEARMDNPIVDYYK